MAEPYKLYFVSFEPRTCVEVEGQSPERAINAARAQLDPDVDWDVSEVRLATPEEIEEEL